MWGYYAYRPRKTKSEVALELEKMLKKNPDMQPVVLEGGKLARTWWAQAWNKNLESYADYENRIERGRSYVRSGSVFDLSIVSGEARALVQGTRETPYKVAVKIKPLSKTKWNAIVEKCSRKVGSLEELASGSFPQEFKELFTNSGDGLFPTPKEITFECSCPDWAYMCKHVASVLYGIGARFDNNPTLFFLLRGIDFTELLKKSVDEKMNSMLKNAGKITGRVMTGVNTYELFGV